jgi:hypothetical protein
MLHVNLPAMKSMSVILAGAILMNIGAVPSAIAGRADCQTQPPWAVPVDVRSGQGDGLALRLRDAIRDAYGCGAGYSRPEPGGAGVLTVTIIGNVRREQAGTRTRVHYRVGYAVWGEPRSQRSGACWADRLRDCARAIRKGTPSINME